MSGMALHPLPQSCAVALGRARWMAATARRLSRTFTVRVVPGCIRRSRA